MEGEREAATDALPIVDQRVPEDEIGIIGEISEYPAKKTSSEKFDLPAGRYLLFSILPNHYQQGMVAEHPETSQRPTTS